MTRFRNYSFFKVINKTVILLPVLLHPELSSNSCIVVIYYYKVIQYSIMRAPKRGTGPIFTLDAQAHFVQKNA